MEATWAGVHALRMRRHFLGTGEKPDAATIAHRVGGLQAQVAAGPALSVAARDGSSGVESLVRMWTLRGTVHLVREEDVDLFAAALGASVAARETRLWPKRGVPSAAEGEVTAAILSSLKDGPLDRHAIADRVAEQFGPAYKVLLEHPWGIGFKPAVARGLLRMEGSGPQVRFRPPQTAPVQVDEREAQQWLAEVYLKANVAGDVASFATWTGLSRAAARAAIDAVAEQELRIKGRAYRAMGWERDAEPPAGQLKLPAFDAYTLAVADKSGFCAPAMQQQIWKKGGWVSSIVVENGLPIDQAAADSRLTA